MSGTIHLVENVHPRIEFIGGVCPEGHYCPTGSTQPEPCPPGKVKQEIVVEE